MDWTPTTLRAFREHLGKSQADFADLLGFSRYQSVSNLEAGRREITDTVKRLLDYMARDAGYGQDEKADVPDRLDAAAAELQGIARQLREERGQP